MLRGTSKGGGNFASISSSLSGLTFFQGPRRSVRHTILQSSRPCRTIVNYRRRSILRRTVLGTCSPLVFEGRHLRYAQPISARAAQRCRGLLLYNSNHLLFFSSDTLMSCVFKPVRIVTMRSQPSLECWIDLHYQHRPQTRIIVTVLGTQGDLWDSGRSRRSC
jgi:hypothetical protein